jgi:hypothetical protein
MELQEVSDSTPTSDHKPLLPPELKLKLPPPLRLNLPLEESLTGLICKSFGFLILSLLPLMEPRSFLPLTLQSLFEKQKKIKLINKI